MLGDKLKTKPQKRDENTEVLNNQLRNLYTTIDDMQKCKDTTFFGKKEIEILKNLGKKKDIII